MSQPDDTGADKERAKCPHCLTHLSTRSSRSVTPLFKQKVLQCRNPDCGATFGASSGITHQISPSACPDPAVELPFSAPRTRRAANDGQPKQLHRGPGVPPPDNDETGPDSLTG